MRRQRHGWRARRNSHSRPRRRSHKRGAGGDAGDEVEGAADTERDGDRQFLSVLLNPDVLAGMAVGDEEQIGRRGGEMLADLRPVGLGGRAAVGAGDGQAGIETGQFGGGAFGHAGGGAEEEDPPPLQRGPFTEAVDGVGAGYALVQGGPRTAAQPRARRCRRAYRDPLPPAPVRRRDGGAPP